MNRKFKEAEEEFDGLSDHLNIDLGEKDNKADFEQLSAVSTTSATLYEGLSPIRCFNYETQLRVAGELITDSLNAEKNAVLILDKNAEKALLKLEALGFTLRDALLERKLDIYYYRKGVRSRNFFRKDYQAIFDAALSNRKSSVQHLIMIDFNALFANSVRDAVSNQIEDFCSVAENFDISVSGLFSPHSWYQSDFLTEQLQFFLGGESMQEARHDDATSVTHYSVRVA